MERFIIGAWGEIGHEIFYSRTNNTFYHLKKQVIEMIDNVILSNFCAANMAK